MNNELIERIDYSPSMSEGEVEILLLDCKAEIQLLQAEIEALRQAVQEVKRKQTLTELTKLSQEMGLYDLQNEGEKCDML